MKDSVLERSLALGIVLCLAWGPLPFMHGAPNWVYVLWFLWTCVVGVAYSVLTTPER